MRQPSQQKLPLVRGQPADEVGPLAEHVQQVQHCQHYVQVEAGEQEAEVFHGAVEVAGEGVLYKQGCEVEGPQHLELQTHR